MSTKKKLLLGSAGAAAGGAGLDVDEVFSTNLWVGTGSDVVVTTGIDLQNEGGIVWVKNRGRSSTDHTIWTRNDQTGWLKPNTTAAITNQNWIRDWTTTTYTAAGNSTNYASYSGDDYVGWTFRKAPKFFDVVTWTGSNFGGGRQISHNLGSVPAIIIIKRTSAVSAWYTWHRSRPNAYTVLDEADAESTSSTKYYFGDGTNVVAPTSTEFTTQTMNENGHTYVAYLFAHNDSGDGGFGPDSDQDIIKCGSYTGNTSTRPSIDLGFEPQFLMIKRTDSDDNWYMLDTMRGIVTSAGNDTYLYANTSGAEATVSEVLKVTSTGFKLEDDFGGWNASGGTYIYMAIRRGPLAVPDDATKVFAIDNQTASSAPFLTSNFPVDMVLRKDTAGGNSEIMSRLTQGKGLIANSSGAEQSDSVAQFDFNDGCLDGTGTDTSRYGWMWRRAPSYFDVVAYQGTGSNRTVSHNLGVAPEMMWVKERNGGRNWAVYHSALGGTKYLYLNTTDAEAAHISIWNNTAPTSSVFSVGTANNTNRSGGEYIAYLFATVAGVSKVGSFSHTSGSTTNVDCGFSSGARFVLLKRTSGTSGWFTYDTERGIVSGNDALLYLNSTNAENGSFDIIDPYSSGFTISGPDFYGGTHIFYAIA
jgi:hypothetical protein